MRWSHGVGVSLSIVCMLAAGGCSNGELSEAKRELVKLADRCDRSDQELAGRGSEVAAIARELEEAKRELVSARSQLEGSAARLKEIESARAELAKKAAAFEEKNYDLEMAYGNLIEQIRDLRSQLDLREERLREAQEAVRHGEDDRKEAEDRHTSALGNLRLETDAARSESGRLRAELQAASRSIERLAAEKLAVEAASKAAAAEAAELGEKLVALTVEAQAAGIELPAEAEPPSDWEVVKRIARARLAALGSGEVRGDGVDLASAAALSVLILLLGASACATVIAFRLKRRLRAGVAPSLTVEELYDDEYERSTDGAGEGETEEDFATVLGGEKEAGGWRRTSIERRSPRLGVGSEATELVEPVATRAEPGSTEVMERAFLPIEKGVTPAAKEEDDVLGELRQVINRKFDELLEK